VTRPRSTADPADPDTAITPDDPDGAQALEAWEEIDRLRAEAGGGGNLSILVFKRREDGARNDRIRAFPADQLDLDSIPDKYGGGDYVLRLLGPNRQYIKQFRVSWSTDVYPRTPARAVASAVAPPAAGGDAVAELVAELRASRQAQAAGSSGLMEKILLALVANMKPPSMTDTVAQLQALQALSQNNPKAPIELLRDAVKEGIALGRSGTGAAGDDDEEGGGMARVVEKGIDALTRLLDTKRFQAAVPVGPAPAGAPSPAPAAPVTAVHVAAARLPAHLQAYAWLAGYVPQAITFARQGMAAERLAGVLYDMVPESYLAQLEDFARLDRTQRREILARLDGRLSPYLDYLDEIAGHLVAIFDQDTDDASDGEGKGNAGNDDPGAAESA
jgi:hypothetical protein